ncbi:hypothetical protein BH11BAC2_BH11BAC2_01860 [soil metagenome]
MSMKKVHFILPLLILLGVLKANISKAQFIYINGPGTDFCNSQVVNYTLGNYDPTYNYEWYISAPAFDYSQTGLYTETFVGSSQSITISTPYNSGHDILVRKIDPSTLNVIDGASLAAVGNMSPYTIPSYYNNNSCGYLEVPHPFSMNFFGAGLRWSMWYKNGVPTGWQYPHFDGPFTNGGVYQYKLLLTCGDTLSTAPITVLGDPIPVVTASGPTIFCNGDSVTLTLQTPGFSVWNWLKNGNSIAGTSGKTELKVFESGNYSIQVYNGTGGGGNCFQLSAPITVTKNSGPLITNASVGCTGDSVLLQCNAATTYLWKKNGSNISGANTQNIWVKTTGNYQVVTTGLTCNTSASKTITFYPKSTISVTPSGSVSLCNGNATTLVASGNNIFKYEWYRNNIALVGANFTALTVTKGGAYKCVVTNEVGCTKTSAPTSVSIPASTALPVNTLTLQPDTAGIDSWVTCEFGNFSTNYKNTPLMEISNWYKYFRTAERMVLKFDLSKLPVNSPIVSSNLKLWIDTIATKHNTAQNLNFKRFIQDWAENTISWSNEPDSTTFQSVMIPLQTLSSKTYLNANIIDFVKHWSYNPTENYGMLIQMDELYEYGWWMEIASGDNASASHRPKLTIQYSYAKIDSSGPLHLCTGGSVTFTTNAGYTYQWYKNGVAIAGATSVNYTTSTAGSYYVVLSNNSGCSVTSSTKIITINGVPNSIITATGNGILCLGSSLTLSVDSLAGYNFLWKRNGSIIAGATQRKYSITLGGTYSVTITSNCGVSATGSSNYTMVSNPTATLTAGGPTTFCNGQSVLFTANNYTGVTYQWRKNGLELNGQTAQSYLANTAGYYSVRENANGCFRTSSGAVVTINCREGSFEEKNSSILVLPNPFTSSTELIVPEDLQTDQLKFMLFDLNGKLIVVIPCTGKSTFLHRLNLKAGMYLLKTFNDELEIGINKILIQD